MPHGRTGVARARAATQEIDMSETPVQPEPTKREKKNESRRRAILDAALEIFSAHGFAAARVEDIARDAKVAKGTIYIHFTDKKDIFNTLVLEDLLALHQSVRDTLARPELPLHERLWRMAQPFLQNNGVSRSMQIIRLIHAEGLHNPSLVQPYHEQIISTLATLQYHMREVGLRGPVCEHPQLIMAPLIQGIIWQGLMGGLAPQDIAGAYRANLDALLSAAGYSCVMSPHKEDNGPAVSLTSS